MPSSTEASSIASARLAEAAASAVDTRKRRASTFVVMVGTLLSRFAGLAREVLTAAIFGASTSMAAFTVALQIPGLIRSPVTLTSALVPVFTDLVEKGEEERAWRVAGTIISLILIFLIPLTLLSMWAAPAIVDLAVHDQFGQRDRTVALLRIMLPTMILLALGGVVTGILNAYGHFSVPALAPIAWNVVIVLIVLVSAYTVQPRYQIHMYAVGVLVGTAVQLLIPIPWLRHHGGRLWTAFAIRDPYVKSILLGMMPVALGLILLDANILVNTYFSTRVPLHLVSIDTGPAVVDKAFRIFQMPEGIFSLAVTSVFFPLFARLSARGDLEGFSRACMDGLRQLFVLLLPAAALMFALSEPIVRVVYERGIWDPAQTPLVADTLQMFALGLVPGGAILLLVRAFFSLRMPWVPALAGLLNLGANVVIAALVHTRMGTRGIAMSTSVASLVMFMAMYLVLRRHLAGLSARQLAAVFARALGAAVVASAVGWGIARTLVAYLGHGLIVELPAVGLAAAATYVVYGVLVVRLKLMDASAFRTMLRPAREP